MAFIFCCTWLIAGAAAQDGRWISPGPTLSHAQLVDQDDKARSMDDLLRDRPVLVNFFFTGCQAVCPTQTAQLALLQAEISKCRALTGSQPLLISVSLDPYGDTPASIRAYAERFGLVLGDKGNWLMLSGTHEQLSAVWRVFDQENGDPSQHASLFWIGHPASKRWTRADVTTEPSILLKLLTEANE
ncbi:SCO family protein [Rhizobium sp. PL01]|uniref:SCO family protein n=1 Tax=Rhizobium sp. PL01 TaxID=3085631 RepID=UPI002981F845|nr:SCO family protein [Rhizobium sp. PL01]MDW5316782.1 SCO family protein [Rhizobium sp. PL01]